MNQVKLSFVLASTLLGAVASALGGCSDDDGADVLPKDPTAQAGSGGGGGSSGASGGAGMGGSGGGAGVGGGAGDAGLQRPPCPAAPEPVDAGAADAGDAGPGDAGLGDAGQADAGDVTARELSFAADIHPIFREYCRPCHEDEFSGGHNVAADDPREAYGFLVGMAASIVPRVNGGNMPPECNGFPGDPGCITVAELQLIQSWEAQCYPP